MINERQDARATMVHLMFGNLKDAPLSLREIYIAAMKTEIDFLTS